MYSKEIYFKYAFLKLILFAAFFSVSPSGAWGLCYSKYSCCIDDVTQFVKKCLGKPNDDYKLTGTVYTCAENDCDKYKGCIDKVKGKLTPKDLAADIIKYGNTLCDESAEMLEEKAKEIEAANNSTTNSTANITATPYHLASSTEVYSTDIFKDESSTPQYSTAKPTTIAQTLRNIPTTINGAALSTLAFITNALSTTESSQKSSPTNNTDINSSFAGNHSANVHPTDVSTTEMVRDTLEYTKDLGYDAASTVYTDLSELLSTTLAVQNDDDDDGGLSLGVKIGIVAACSALAAGATLYAVYRCRKQKKCCFADSEAQQPGSYDLNPTKFYKIEDGGDVLLPGYAMGESAPAGELDVQSPFDVSDQDSSSHSSEAEGREDKPSSSPKRYNKKRSKKGNKSKKFKKGSNFW